MSKNLDPAFPFYAQDFLTGVMFLTNEEIGIYIKILCKQWTDGAIPKKRLGFLIGCGWDTLSDELKEKFRDNGDTIENERLEEERKKRSAFKRKQSENGKKGGRPRKSKNPNKTQPQSQKKPLEDENEYESENEEVNEFENELKKNEAEIFKINCQYQTDANEFEVIEVLHHLNLAADMNFKESNSSNLWNIRARLKYYDKNDLRDVIDLKVREWASDPKMRQHLNPTTLFDETKFEKYIQQVRDIKNGKIKLNATDKDKYAALDAWANS